MSSYVPKSMLQIILHTQEKARSLIHNMSNQFSEYLLRSIDNDVHHFKDMMRQTDRHEFIKAMKTEIDTHQKSNYWELWKC